MSIELERRWATLAHEHRRLIAAYLDAMSMGVSPACLTDLRVLLATTTRQVQRVRLLIRLHADDEG
jgi:hypothetical protein